MLGVQIITGIVLAMHYTPHVDLAFNSVETIMRDVNYGWLLRYVHSNGASMFFIAVYIHIFRGMYYGSYKEPREVLWILGVIIYLLMMATGFMAWGGIFWLDGVWYAIGGAKGERPHLLGVGDRTVCLAQADDWLNTHETDESAFKTRSWLRQPPTEKQLQYLPPECRHDFGLTRYRASALMTFGFNKRAIRQLIDSAAARPERRAA